MKVTRNHARYAIVVASTFLFVVITGTLWSSNSLAANGVQGDITLDNVDKRLQELSDASKANLDYEYDYCGVYDRDTYTVYSDQSGNDYIYSNKQGLIGYYQAKEPVKGKEKPDSRLSLKTAQSYLSKFVDEPERYVMEVNEFDNKTDCYIIAWNTYCGTVKTTESLNISIDTEGNIVSFMMNKTDAFKGKTILNEDINRAVNEVILSEKKANHTLGRVGNSLVLTSDINGNAYLLIDIEYKVQDAVGNVFTDYNTIERSVTLTGQ